MLAACCGQLSGQSATTCSTYADTDTSTVCELALGRFCTADGGSDVSSAPIDGGASGDSGIPPGLYSCTHSPCVAGVALTDGCDANLDETVNEICNDGNATDAECCTVAWTASCVEKADQLCATPGCQDPGC